MGNRRTGRHTANKHGRRAGKGCDQRVNVIEVWRIVSIIEAVLKLIGSVSGL